MHSRGFTSSLKSGQGGDMDHTVAALVGVLVGLGSLLAIYYYCRVKKQRNEVSLQTFLLIGLRYVANLTCA